MSWTSSLFACLVPVEAAAGGAGARDIIQTATNLADHVFASSRNGVLPGRLQTMFGGNPQWAALYLLEDEVVLAGAALAEQHELLCRLIEAIETAPAFIVEATRERHDPGGFLHMAGFEPRPFEMVYPADAVIRDGWVYFHTEDQVRALLAAAPCGPDPCPPGDDDGESLQFVFALLKSHRALLRKAMDVGSAVAFAEMST